MDKSRWKLSWDKKGELENLPLLLILFVVIIACLIFSTIFVLDLIRMPVLEDIDIYIDGVLVSENPTITYGTYAIYVMAKDDYGQLMGDVLIDIKGAGYQINVTTDSKGKADFGMLTFDMENGNFIRIKAVHEGSSSEIFRRVTLTE